METILPARPPRSLVRRCAVPVGLSILLLAGGGAGVYWFTQGNWSGYGQASQSTVKTRSASQATEELKHLFASSDADDAEALSTEALFGDSLSDEPQEIEKPQTPTGNSAMAGGPSPSSGDVVQVVGDRYASLAPALPAWQPEEPTPVAENESVAIVETDETNSPREELESSDANNEPAAATAASLGSPAMAGLIAGAANQLDVTRGQDAGHNPLRQSSVQTVSYDEAEEDADDARAAFENFQQSQPFPGKSGVGEAEDSFQEEASDPLAAALQNAQPLPQAQPESGRYADASSRYLPPAEMFVESREQSPVPADPRSATLGSSDDYSGRAGHSLTPTLADPPSGVSPLPGRNASADSPDRPSQLDLSSTGITPTPGLSGGSMGTGRPGERILEGPQSPSVVLQKIVPSEIQVGKRCTFAIRVQNTGQGTAHQVTIHDEVPLGTELVGTSPRAKVNGSKVVWDLGTLSVGEERIVEMELLPRDEGELGSVATVSLAAQASAKTRCTRPDLALRLTSQPKVHVGQKHPVTIEVSNPGSGVATNVMLLETLPPGVSHEAGPALEFEIGTLKPGETRKLELMLTAEEAGRVNNVMTARADAGLVVEANCEFEIIAPELQLSVEGPQKRFLERPATYQVSIDNPGSAPAKDVQLVTHLPKGMQYVSANNMGEYDATTHSVYWSLAELPSHERGTVELVTLPIEAGAQRIQVTTKARDGLTDQMDKHVLVEGIAALMFEVIDLQDPIELGGETTYEIRVLNQGSKAATNLQVTAIMPSGLRALSGQGETKHHMQGDRVVFEPVQQLSPKAEATFRIQAQGTQPGDQRVRVQITTDEIREPITKEESTRVYADH